MPGLREMGDNTPFMRPQSAHCSVPPHSSPCSSGEPVITGGLLLWSACPGRRFHSGATGGVISVVFMWRPTPGRALAASELRSRLLVDAQYDELFTLEIRIRFRIGGRAVINR